MLEGASNLVFSSGSFDGWSSAGIATNLTTQSITSILIDQGAHHLDLMFSHPNDPVSVVQARELELNMIKQWIDAYDPVAVTSWGERGALSCQ